MKTNFEYPCQSPEYIDDIISHNNQLEQKAEENETAQNTSSQLNKLSIMEVIDSTRLKNPSLNSLNELDSNGVENVDINEEPMTFNPKKISEPEIIAKSSFSSYNTNECGIIMRGMKEKILEQYDRFVEYYDKIKKQANMNDIEMNQLIISCLDIVREMSQAFTEIFSKAETDLFDLKEKYTLTKSFQIDKVDNSSFMKSTMSTFLKTQQSNQNNPVAKIEEIDEVEKVYKERVTNLEDEIEKLREHNIYYEKIINESKTLIDELYNKNQLITSKLIKYKQIAKETQK